MPSTSMSLSLPGPRQLVGQPRLRPPRRQVVTGQEARHRHQDRARSRMPREPRREQQRRGEAGKAMVRQRRRLLQHDGAGQEGGGEEAHG